MSGGPGLDSTRIEAASSDAAKNAPPGPKAIVPVQPEKAIPVAF
jgi:hypothetical protein